MPCLLEYPPEVTEAQIANTLAALIRTMRWPEYAVLEQRYGLASLPDEPRATGLMLARRLRRHFAQIRHFKEAQAGLRDPERHFVPHPVDVAPYLVVLAAYLPEARLAFFLSDIRHFALAADERDKHSSTERMGRSYLRWERPAT